MIMIQRVNNKEDMIDAIKENIEWLETTEEESVECISIENLEGILTRYFNETIKI